MRSGRPSEQNLILDRQFNYIQAEWDDIEHSISAGRQQRLSENDRTQLLMAGNEYRRGIAARKSGRYLSPKQRAGSFAKTAKLCGQLCDAIEDAAISRYSDGWRGEPAVIIPRELTQRLLVSLIGRHHDPGFTKIDDQRRLLSYGEVVGLPAAIQSEFKQLADPFFWSVSLVHSFSGRLDPSVVYYQRILFLWTERFGGKLRISRHPDDPRKISGPLVRYFLAVTRPVMGDRAPSLQSLPDIVDRQKEFQKWFVAYTRLTDAANSQEYKERRVEYIRLMERKQPRIANWAKKLFGEDTAR